MAWTKLLLNQMLRHKWIDLILLTACLVLFLSLHFPYVECVTGSYLFLPQLLCLFSSFYCICYKLDIYLFVGLWNDKLYSVQNTFLYEISEAGVICSSWHFILYKSCILYGKVLGQVPSLRTLPCVVWFHHWKAFNMLSDKFLVGIACLIRWCIFTSVVCANKYTILFAL